MDTGLTGPRGARAARHVETALGLEAGLVVTQPLPREVNRVRELVRIPDRAVCQAAQVLRNKRSRLINVIEIPDSIIFNPNVLERYWLEIVVYIMNDGVLNLPCRQSRQRFKIFRD